MPHAVASVMVDGVVLGALIALIALGHACVRQLTVLIEFAHGKVFLVAAYGGLTACAYLLPTFLNQGLYLVLPLLLVAGAVVAVLVAAVMGLPSAGSMAVTGRFTPLLLVLVVSVWLHEAIRWLCPGADEIRTVPEIFTAVPPNIFVAEPTVAARWIRLLVGAFSLALVLVLHFLINRYEAAVGGMERYRRCRHGRPVGDDLEVTVVVWFVYTTALVGFAGILYGADPTFVAVDIGYQSGLVTVATAVLGWTGRVIPALAGGMALGLAVALGGDAPPGGAAYYVGCVLVLVAVVVLRQGGPPRVLQRRL